MLKKTHANEPDAPEGSAAADEPETKTRKEKKREKREKQARKAEASGKKKKGKDGDFDPNRLTKKKYEAELERLQKELVKLQEWVRVKRLRVVVLFEGRDAAGKGGVISR